MEGKEAKIPTEANERYEDCRIIKDMIPCQTQE
jgi:hypothetical protein